MENTIFSEDRLFELMDEERFHRRAKIAMIDDDTLHETRAHGTEQFPFHCYYKHNGSAETIRSGFFWHWHSELELLLVQEGTIDYMIGEQRAHLSAGMGILVNSGALHSLETTGNYAYTCLVFAPELLAPIGSAIYEKYVQPLLRSNMTCMPLAQNIVWQRDILRCVEDILHKCTHNEPLLELEIQKQMLTLWSIMLRHYTPEQAETRTARDMQTQARLCLMMQYIWEHYTERITLEEIAGAANISKSSALRCFRSGIQSSPVDYLNEYRLHRAKKLLHTTELPVSDIALSVGFDNVGYFDRMFKRAVSMTPRQFRRHTTQ